MIASAGLAAAVHVDVQVQAIGGQIVTGLGNVTDDGGTTLDVDFNERVFGDNLGSNFRSADPGFNVLETGNSLIASQGAEGFADGAQIEFDFMPMTFGGDVMNIAYWDGSGAVDFGPAPTGTSWIFGIRRGFGRDEWTAFGDDAIVPGGLIGTVRENQNGKNRFHDHGEFEVERGGNELSGVYMVSLRMRVAGYEPSEPVIFVHHSLDTPRTIGDIAQDWTRDNYTLLTNAPGDYNGDGTVDAADYTVWRDAGSPLDGSPEQYAVWSGNFGDASPAASASALAVPEPGSLLSLIAALSTGLATMRGRR
ncbi:MAG: PEP-CTERM sorting domain-containing protein [Planctomycetota bacterium]